MAILDKTYDLDILPQGTPLIVRTAQNSAGMHYNFVLHTGFGDFDVPEDTNVYLRIKDMIKKGELSFNESGIAIASFDMIFFSNKINVKALREFAGYQFRCLVSDKYGNTVESNTATFHVYNAIEITTQPLKYYFGNTSTGTQISVVATGNNLTYQWQYLSASGSGAWINWNTSFGATTSTLSFTIVNAGYNGRKTRCLITDADGNQKASNIATIYSQIVSISSQPVEQYAYIGQSISFNVTLSGTYSELQWMQKTTSDTDWVESTFDGNDTDTLSFTTVAGLDGAYFKLRIKLVNGNYSAYYYSEEIAFHCAASPYIYEQPEDCFIPAVNNDMSFRIMDVSAPNVTYRWQYQTENSTSWTNAPTLWTGYNTNSTTYTVTSSTFNRRKFRCKIVDGNGTVAYSDIARLYIGLNTVQITRQPSDITRPIGDEASFSVEATGDGLSYKWQMRKDNDSDWINFVGSEIATTEKGKIPFEILLQNGDYKFITATSYLDVR